MLKCWRLGRLLVVSRIVGFGSRTSSNQVINAMLLLSIHCWRLWSSSVLNYCCLCGIILVLLVLMNPSGVVLTGAVQPFLDYSVADFNWSAAV
ncbi:hypothetical protein PTKIN_Ptkin19aG0032200 [Pterospermum kingtungense]